MLLWPNSTETMLVWPNPIETMLVWPRSGMGNWHIYSSNHTFPSYLCISPSINRFEDIVVRGKADLKICFSLKEIQEDLSTVQYVTFYDVEPSSSIFVEGYFLKRWNKLYLFYLSLQLLSLMFGQKYCWTL